jgi:TolA-binding protein
MKGLASIVLACLLAGGCASVPPKPAKSGKSAKSGISDEAPEVQNPQVIEWLENEALVEWQIARVEQTIQQIKALEGGVGSLEKSVNTLATQLAQLTSATPPASLQQLADITL